MFAAQTERAAHDRVCGVLDGARRFRPVSRRSAFSRGLRLELVIPKPTATLKVAELLVVPPARCRLLGCLWFRLRMAGLAPSASPQPEPPRSPSSPRAAGRHSSH